MNIPKEMPVISLRKFNEFADGQSVTHVSSRFSGFVNESIILPLLKKKNWSESEVEDIKSFAENTLYLSLKNSIVLLSALGGNRPPVPEDSPEPRFGVELDFAVHDLAHQALKYTDMYNEISFALIQKQQRETNKEGGAQ